MARSLNGNLLGKAAQLEIADQAAGFEDTLNDDANYWHVSADGARDSLAKITIAAPDLIAEFWNPDNTWKTICLKTEEVLAKIRAEQKRVCDETINEVLPMMQTLCVGLVDIYRVEPELINDINWLSDGEPAALPHAIYDFTPMPDMPTIDFDKIDEIPL